MEIPVFFPNLKKGSTKDCIIQLLTINKSLSNQKIYNALRRDYKLSRSYQTIRQALLELVESGVLEKKSRQYNISIQWIRTMDDFMNLLKKRYIEKKDIKIIDKNTKEIEIKSLLDLGHFFLYSFRDSFFDMSNENDFYMYVQHLWFPFGDWRKRNLLRKFFSKTKSTIYVANSTLGDRILGAFYSHYCKLKFKVKFDVFFDFLIQGDCLAKIYIPKELRKRMDKAYSFRRISFDLIEEITELTYKTYPIKIIISRDKEMVMDIKSRLGNI